MRVAKHSQLTMSKEVRALYPKDYFKRKPEPKRVRKVQLSRPITRTVDRIELTAFSKKGGDLLITGMRHRQPNPITFTATPLKKNPNKIMLYRDDSKMNCLQVFYYLDHPFTVYISDQGELLRIPIEKVSAFSKALNIYLQQAKKLQ